MITCKELLEQDLYRYEDYDYHVIPTFGVKFYWLDRTIAVDWYIKEKFDGLYLVRYSHDVPRFLREGKSYNEWLITQEQLDSLTEGIENDYNL